MQRNAPLPVPFRAVTGLLRPVLRLAFPIHKAAHSSVIAATNDQLGTDTGLLLDRRGRAKPPPVQATDRASQERIAEISAQLVATPSGRSPAQ